MNTIKTEQNKVNTPDAKETKTLSGQKVNNKLTKTTRTEIVPLADSQNNEDVFHPYKGNNIIAGSE